MGCVRSEDIILFDKGWEGVTSYRQIDSHTGSEAQDDSRPPAGEACLPVRVE